MPTAASMGIQEAGKQLRKRDRQMDNTANCSPLPWGSAFPSAQGGCGKDSNPQFPSGFECPTKPWSDPKGQKAQGSRVQGGQGR